MRARMSVVTTTLPRSAAIDYVTGDATSPRGTGTKIIGHVCNNAGGWGKGFVLAVSRRWPGPEAAYRRWYRERASNDFGLGAVQLVRVEPNLWVANMVGQHGIRAGSHGPPVRYTAIDTALVVLAERAAARNASVHLPRIGCGLAGGRWDVVEALIQARLIAAGVPVTVYDYP